MAQSLKLKDTDRPIRDFFNAYRTTNEECVIQDDDNQPVAVVLPMELYRLYQAEWEKDFAVVDRIREKTKGFDPEEVQARVDQAVEGRADCIISGDKHLTKLGTYQGIPMLTPTECVTQYEIP